MDAAAVSHGGAEREYPTESPFPGWSVQDPDTVAAASAAVVREVTARAGAAGRPIAAVAFSGAMHSLIALAPDGSPLTPSVTWADSRAAAQARRLRDSGEWLALHRRTGTPVHPMSPLVKLLWFREQPAGGLAPGGPLGRHQGVRAVPAGRAAGGRRVDRLGHRACTGWPTATGTPRRSTWLGSRREQLPALHATTDVVARLDADVAAWGLPAGTPDRRRRRATASSPTSASTRSPPGWPPAPSGPAPPSVASSAAPSVDDAGPGVLLRARPRPLGGRRGDQQRRQRAPLARPRSRCRPARPRRRADRARRHRATRGGGPAHAALPVGERAPHWAGDPARRIPRADPAAHPRPPGPGGPRGRLPAARPRAGGDAGGGTGAGRAPGDRRVRPQPVLAPAPRRRPRDDRSGSRPASRDRPPGPPCSATSPSDTSPRSTTRPPWCASPRSSTPTGTPPASTAGCCRRSPGPPRRSRT